MLLRSLSLIIMLMPSIAMADGLAPSLNSFPILYDMVGQNPVYHDAAFKAQEAFFVQSGIGPQYDKVTGAISQKATNTATAFVDTHSPVSSKTITTIVGVGYAVGVRKHIARSFRNPLFPRVTNTVDISQDSQSLGFRIEF